MLMMMVGIGLWCCFEVFLVCFIIDLMLMW